MIKTFPQEYWVIIPTLFCERRGTGGYDVLQGYLLKGINGNTRRVIHEYGPFLSMEYLENFAREEGIILERPQKDSADV